MTGSRGDGWRHSLATSAFNFAEGLARNRFVISGRYPHQDPLAPEAGLLRVRSVEGDASSQTRGRDTNGFDDRRRLLPIRRGYEFAPSLRPREFSAHSLRSSAAVSPCSYTHSVRSAFVAEIPASSAPLAPLRTVCDSFPSYGSSIPGRHPCGMPRLYKHGSLLR